MKFPRNARIIRTQFEATAFASVFFLLLIFMMLGSLLYTPGVRVELPVGDDVPLPGTDRPTLSVAVGRDGQLYFENQLIHQASLQLRLRQEAAEARGPVTLVVQADKDVKQEQLIELALLARKAGIQELLLATLPRVYTNSFSLYSPAAP